MTLTNITFDRNTAQFILDSLDEFIEKTGTDCIYCGNEVTAETLALVSKDGLLCDNPVCLVAFGYKLKN